jgi:hypothetical protein
MAALAHAQPASKPTGKKDAPQCDLHASPSSVASALQRWSPVLASNFDPKTLKDLPEEDLFLILSGIMMSPIDEWQLSTKDAASGVHIYSRTNPNKNLKFAQFLATVTLPLDTKAASALINSASSRLEWDTFVSHFVELTPNLVYFTTHPIGIISGREFVDRRIIRTTADGSIVCVCTSTESDLAPKKSGVQRAWNYTNGVAIIPNKAGCTVRMLACSDARGWMPQWVSEWGTPGAMLKILKDMHGCAVKRAAPEK